MKTPKITMLTKSFSTALSLLLLFGSFFTATAATAATAGWPDDPLQIVVPFNPGGSADRLARGLAEHMSPRLGVPVTIVNRSGGAGALGATYFQQQPADGNTLLVMQATPYLASAIEIGGAPIKWEDFQLLSAQWNDYGIVAVHRDSPYKSFKELLDAMKAKPGAVSSGVIYGNGGHLQTLLIMKALGIPQDNLRFVTYNGGSKLRAALAGNHVDFEILAAQAAKSISDEIRALAVVNDEESKDWDAPLLNEVLGDLGISKLPSIGGNITGLIVHSSLQKDYPERYKIILEAYKNTLESDEFQDWASKASVGASWLPPKDSQALVDSAYDVVKQYAPTLK